MTILDWILGRDKERARQEAEAKVEMTRPAHQEAGQEHVRLSGPERVSKPPEPAKEPKKQPGERLMPHEAERMREAHDRKPEPASAKEQAPEQEATRMAYTRTAQPPPSLGGAGTAFVNPRVQQPRQSVADEMLAEARAKLAKEEAAMTPQQKLERDQQRGADQSRDDGRKL